MLLTIFLAIVFCAAMALMLISCVAFIQDNKFFSSAPKEAREVLIQREQELFYGARAIGWTLFIISVLMILGVLGRFPKRIHVLAVLFAFCADPYHLQGLRHGPHRQLPAFEIPLLPALLPRGGARDGGEEVRLQPQKPAAEAVCDLPGGVRAGGLDLQSVLKNYKRRFEHEHLGHPD